MLPTRYKILSNILVSKLTPYVDEIIDYHQCGFWHNRSTTDQTFCIRQIQGKKWEYNVAVHQLFIDFEKAYDWFGREVSYNILTESDIPMKLIRLIKMCFSDSYSKVCTGKNLYDALCIQNDLKQDLFYCHCFSTFL